MLKNTFFIFLISLLQLSCKNIDHDETKTVSVDEISYLTDKDFTLKEVKNENFIKIIDPKISYKNGLYWFKISLKRIKESDKTFFIQINETSISSVEIYDENKKISEQRVSVENPIICVEILFNKSNTYYIKAHFNKQVHFPLKVFEKESYSLYKQKRALTIGMYYGLAIMVFIFNLIFFVSLKDVTFLFYSLFLLSINMSFSCFDGTSYYYFSQEIIDALTIIFHYSIAVCGVLFASDFLNLKYFYPKADTYGRLSLVIPIFGYGIYFYTNEFLYYAISDLFCLLILSYYWVLGIYMIKKQEYAKFFVIGYSMVLISGIFFVIPLSFGISGIGVDLTKVKFGALFEMLVLTYAITYRVKNLKKENYKYRTELKSYLDEIYGLKEKLKFQKNNEIQDSISEKVESLKNNFKLTDREVDILLKITEGCSNHQIAEQLFISVNTVKYHTKNLYDKLDIKKRSQISSKILFS